MPIPKRTTVLALRKSLESCASLETWRQAYGVRISRGTISRIQRGECVSKEAEAEIRAALGLKRARPRYWRPCLSLDPAKRIKQLETLLAEARNQKTLSLHDKQA